MTTEREAFEGFAIAQYKNISLEQDAGEYRSSLASTLWLFWQASRKVAPDDAADIDRLNTELNLLGSACDKIRTAARIERLELADERDQLKAKNEKLAEALKSVVNVGGLAAVSVAEQALKENT